MSVSVPYPTLGAGLADSSKIDSNVSALVSKFGNIDNSDVKTGAAIDVAKLSASNYELIFKLNYAGTPSISSTVPAVIVAVPQDDTTTTYTCTAWAYANTVGQGAATCVFKVDYGSFTGAANAWATVSNVIASQTLPAGANPSQTGSTTFGATSLANSGVIATPRFLGLFFTAAGGTPATTVFNVTIKAKKALRT